MKIKLLIIFSLLSNIVNAAELLSANEIRAIHPNINEVGFIRIVEAIKDSATFGNTSVTVDLSDINFEFIQKYMYLLQNNGYCVDSTRGKAGLNSAVRISWDIAEKGRGFSGNEIAPLSHN